MLQDILDFDKFLLPYADNSIVAGIKMVNSMTFTMKDHAWWNAVHPLQPIAEGDPAYKFHYKLSM